MEWREDGRSGEGVGSAEVDVDFWEKLTVGKDFNSDRLCFLLVEDHWMK
jgi:hypothetical protein